jgi:hypothetical protein
MPLYIKRLFVPLKPAKFTQKTLFSRIFRATIGACDIPWGNGATVVFGEESTDINKLWSGKDDKLKLSFKLNKLRIAPGQLGQNIREGGPDVTAFAPLVSA